MAGLGKPPPVAGLDPPVAGPEPPPTPGAPLALQRRPAGHRPTAGLALGQVEAGLGPHRPARHDESLSAGTGHREGVDDPQVHPGQPGGIGALARVVGGHV